MDRRSVLVGAGVAGLTILTAGCLGDDDPPEEPVVNGWFNGVDNYDGFEDMTDQSEVTVLVGTGSAGFEYDPPAITIAPGTTVVFEWTGKGGDHNVEHRDGDWENPEGVVSRAGHTWEREFTEPGTHRYLCWPHEGVGMKGAIFVDAYA